MVALKSSAAREYDAYLECWITDPVYRRMLRHARDQFLARYPDVEQWFVAPLLERVGRERRDGIPFAQTTLSYQARSYLHYLGLRGYVWFEWEWLLAVARHRIWELDERLGLTLRRDVDACIDEAAHAARHRLPAGRARPVTCGRPSWSTAGR